VLTAPFHLKSISASPFQRFKADFSLTHTGNQFDPDLIPTSPIELRLHTPEEEISLGPACWLFNFLVRSKAAGFFIPLSGGLDSAATATLVYSMCTIAMKALKEGNKSVKADIERLYGAYHEGELPETPAQLC
jgi:NAD+ synthase (glutamine-hydrolysing)